MEKRNFLFVSLTGLIGDIAWQVAKDGNEVRYYIHDKKERDIADGFVAKSKDWEKDVEWADIIIFDDTLGQGEKAGLVLEGQVMLTVGDETSLLSTGDSFQFDSQRPHRVVNPNDQPAEVLWIMSMTAVPM